MSISLVTRTVRMSILGHFEQDESQLLAKMFDVDNIND